MRGDRFINAGDIEQAIESCLGVSKTLGMDRDRQSFLNEVMLGMVQDGFVFEHGTEKHTDEIWLRLKELEHGLLQDIENLAVTAKGYSPNGEVAVHAAMFVIMLNEAAGIATPARVIRAAECLVEQFGGEVEPARVHAVIKVMMNVLSDVNFLLSDEGQEGDPLRMNSLFLSQEPGLAA